MLSFLSFLSSFVALTPRHHRSGTLGTIVAPTPRALLLTIFACTREEDVEEDRGGLSCAGTGMGSMSFYTKL